MKKNVLIFFVIAFAFNYSIKAQINLVPNPSFEDTLGCPSASGEINKATGWESFCGSPDYYNTCNQNLYDMGVPNNWAGYQNTGSGNAYAGFATYSNSSTNAREFPACNLISPLIIGTKYYISFKIALALTTNIQANYATDKIGAMFTMGAYMCNSLITNNPPVFTDSIITDSLNWTRISGSFIADSAFTYLAIGNFFDDANTDTLKFFNDFSDNAYYYLDDVCVSTDSLYANNYSYTAIIENNSIDNITCYPNPIIDNLIIQNLSHQKIDIEIYNVLGELLFTSLNISEKILAVDLRNANRGILFIKIKSGQQINTYKLLKL